jgi:hypothetical protein
MQRPCPLSSLRGLGTDLIFNRQNALSEVRRTDHERSAATNKSIWKGAFTFGSVSVPISLYPDTRREELKCRLLRASDLSPADVA